ncbi:MAG: hypothetical protein H5U06_04320 [Candidatus Aminicenantes bacterium]|nr:hypothetical protein [Candidatus Aminicenantes bacterium]
MANLPIFLKPPSYVLPLTYGAEILHGAINGGKELPYALDFSVLTIFCFGLFVISLRNVRKKWLSEQSY